MECGLQERTHGIILTLLADSTSGTNIWEVAPGPLVGDKQVGMAEVGHNANGGKTGVPRTTTVNTMSL